MWLLSSSKHGKHTSVQQLYLWVKFIQVTRPTMDSSTNSLGEWSNHKRMLCFRLAIFTVNSNMETWLSCRISLTWLLRELCPNYTKVSVIIVLLLGNGKRTYVGKCYYDFPARFAVHLFKAAFNSIYKVVYSRFSGLPDTFLNAFEGETGSCSTMLIV